MDLADTIAASPVTIAPDRLWVVRGEPAEPGRVWLDCRDGEERTVVLARQTPPAAHHHGPYRALRLHIRTPFEAPGFIAAATTAVGDAGANVLAYSTWSYDYLLVAEQDVPLALAALRRRGFPVEGRAASG